MSASPARLSPSLDADRRVVAFPRCPTAERINAARSLSADQRLDLERLRWLALRSQLAPRADLERACYVLAGQPTASLDRLATVFFRGLAERASSEMVIYRPGAASVSDDECWLLRLVSACRAEQDAAAAALVAWRVAPCARRWMRFLSAAMVRALDAA
ncbi:hypothetical protein D3218_15705 [Aureimonas flava]|uniref:Uncharacterized protein n=1 Tax=Aureimonas flava TaxID=2320271 RepID=A0A3A1WPH4_9HYPH|nr:hypothetical protein [Aureimonas flava]RIX99211.1 hypothetical protein D3218_15705 [Aureimonas flava]